MLSNYKKKMIAALTGIVMLVSVSPYTASAAVSEDLLKDVPEPKQTSMETEKDGLVEIQTGVMDGETFRQIRQRNGFLISNTDGDVYVVATRGSVHVSDEDREELGVDENAQKTIRIIVRGDVASELRELTSSKKQDFCILQADDVVKSKGTVTLRRELSAEPGDKITVVGFPSSDNTDRPLQYESGDAEEHTGKVENAVEIDGVPFIRHTGVVRKSMNGSLLLDEDEYVIGMNNTSKTDDDQYFALSIEEIEKVLDNYGIPYATDRTETAYAKLYQRTAKAVKQDNQSRYKVTSKQKLESELENSVEVMTESPYDLGKLLDADSRLEAAQNELEVKIPKAVWVIVVLGVILILVLIRFIQLFIWRRKNHRTDNGSTRSSEEDSRGHRAARPQVPTPSQSGQHENERFTMGMRRPTEPPQERTLDDPEPTIISRATRSPGRHLERPVDGSILVLYWTRKKQQIIIDQPRFILGKKADAVSFAIEDNRMVSRVHAGIQRTKLGFKITDLQSSNGTYVNEQPIPTEGAILQNGDVIRLANEEFVVEIN